MPPQSRTLFTSLIEATTALGVDQSLVLHGGGNSSAKSTYTDHTGTEQPALFMKASGVDMSEVTQDDFVPLDLTQLQHAVGNPHMTTEDFFTLMRRAAFIETKAASVETLVHAALPHPVVLHTHADAIVTLTNTDIGPKLIREALGEEYLVCDYAMPGPQLATAIAHLWEAHGTEQTRGIVVLNHGLFTFAQDAERALSYHLEAVTAAHALITQRTGNEFDVPSTPTATLTPAQALTIAQTRLCLSQQAKQPLIVATTEALWRTPTEHELLTRGPITPDHVNYVGHRAFKLDATNLDHTTQQWSETLTQYIALKEVPANVPALSHTPRILLSTEHIHAAGRTLSEAHRAQDITAHQRASATMSSKIQNYTPASAEHVHDLEFWPPQINKLNTPNHTSPLQGRIALVTGAASGIGKACAQELLTQGATVVGWDISAGIAETFDSPEFIGMQVDVTNAEAQRQAILKIVSECGGLDIVVVAAGVFPVAQHLTELTADMWAKTMSINVESVAVLFGLVQPYLALSPTFGRVCVVASKNFAAPGPGAAAYSSSKAALTQLSRIAALEWASDGIRVNMVHPDAVFDTALWTEELLAKRAEHYGMSVDDYKRRNLLHTEIKSADVARLVRAMADDTFIATTGAQVPIDGGNERVI